MGHTYEELEVRKRAVDVCVLIYRKFNSCKDFGLRDQITRAAVSIPSNIAEGSERGSRKEFQLFLNYSKGSAAELKTQLLIANKAGIISPDTYNDFESELVQISKMLQ
jgi:four helix bundle protein